MKLRYLTPRRTFEILAHFSSFFFFPSYFKHQQNQKSKLAAIEYSFFLWVENKNQNILLNIFRVLSVLSFIQFNLKRLNSQHVSNPIELKLECI